MHAPTLIDAEVLSALGRLHRAGQLTSTEVEEGLDRLTTIPLTRHPLPKLLAGAWRRRTNLRLADALYVELADQRDSTLLTTDRRLARAWPAAESVGGTE